LIAIGGIALFIGALVVALFWFLGNSDAEKMAVERVQSSPACIERLGTPIKKGLITTGSIQVSGPSGHAELDVPVSGPKGKGDIYLIANKKAGQWQFETLQLAIDGSGNRIDLLNPPAPDNP
jgi:hypothetical protein